MRNILIFILLSFNVAFSSVDINHASLNELTSLKGIGEIKAKRIREFIEKNGCFKNIEELKAVKGIGKVTLSKNKDNIKILPCKKKTDKYIPY